jgi:hypothetical protein
MGGLVMVGTLASVSGNPGAANLGIQVSQKAETNLMLAAYWLHHQEQVYRIPTPAILTLASVCSLTSLCKADLVYKEKKVTIKVPALDSKNWPKLLKAIETYLRSCLAQKEIPLAYVICRDP